MQRIGNPQMKAMLFNLAQQGQISPQALQQVLQFMKARAQFRQQSGGLQAGAGALNQGGLQQGTSFGSGSGFGLGAGLGAGTGLQAGASALTRPRMNPMQRQAIGQLRQLLGNNFNPFVRNLMQGGPQGIGNMMNQLPSAGLSQLPNGGQQLANGSAQIGPNVAGQQNTIINNGGTVNIHNGCAPKTCGTGTQAAQQQPKLDLIKDKWLGQHGKGKYESCGKNEFGKIFKINDGKWKGHTAVPTAPGKYNVFKGDSSNPSNQVGTWNAPGGKKDKVASPLTFDVNGDGKVSTTSKENGKKIDINGDGKVDQSAWAGKGDGVMKFGAGNSGKELLGNNTDVAAAGKRAADSFRKNGNEQQAQAIEQRLASGQFNAQPKNGFEALKQISELINPGSAKDGKLDNKELGMLEQTIGLRMEVDGQDRGLMDANVAGVNLGYQDAGKNADEQGNEHRQVGAGFIRGDGGTGKVNDVWFQYA